MITTQRARKLLQDIGLTPMILKDAKEPDKDLVFITDEVVWDKLFTAMTLDLNIFRGLKSIPHYRMIERIVVKYNPKILQTEIEGREAWGVDLESAIGKENLTMDKYPRLDKCFQCLFYLVAMFITPTIDKIRGVKR